MNLREQYDEAYANECANKYPSIDAFEKRCGFAVDRDRLNEAARVLACPLKVNPPNWQHGRVIYAAARQYLDTQKDHVTFLDIGTAKGFSAVVMSWAIADSGGQDHQIVSIDIVEPYALVERNSVLEIDGLQTVDQFVAPFIAKGVHTYFLGGGSARWLTWAIHHKIHVGFAFVDGKHSFDSVTFEATAIKKLQARHDLILFDDLQLPEVQRAVSRFSDYAREHIFVRSQRQYMLASKC